ncbi:glycosyltransferase family 61 protein [Sphingobium sp. H39-3-25]|uniref:glycosyltransferase family 61 protein n=1 Tax=Sphingobium arseniciresistens TaxID=3030834 RepID=UPI0023B9F70D|nr:glycosyltransferase family 61 protein [Sphingobium arseniciresistens]
MIKPAPPSRSLFSFRPGIAAFRKLLGKSGLDITATAVDRWQVAPGSTISVRPAKMLAGQLDRIRGAEFGTVDEVVRDFMGGFDSIQAATIAYRMENVLLLDGVLYSGEAARHLKQRTTHLPVCRTPAPIASGALYESWLGNRWFGNWLSDDCLTYRLAEAAAQPFTTTPAIGHKYDYEQRLGIQTTRVSSALFEQLVLFDDHAHNSHRRERAMDMRRRLIGDEPPRHPGVFLLRGTSGDQRVLRNENAIAEYLAARRGFQILDPMKADVDGIVRACAGALVVAGVEGSHLVHGLMMMPPEARALVIQPPARAVSALKLITDRQGQDYSLVVGVGTNEAFDADAQEIERTLDLA